MKISIELNPIFVVKEAGEDLTEIFDCSKLPISVQEEILNLCYPMNLLKIK